MQRSVDVQGCTNIVVAGCKGAWNKEIIEYSTFSITYRAITRSTDEFRLMVLRSISEGRGRVAEPGPVSRNMARARINKLEIY